ncbi:hypothetical protein AB0392_37875 [Nonomuraea angiospora]|uniref:hypothetical protein n=1 Tax=Nonomuraea angiospora TaxID=46172 RepID=UPI00344C037D
MSDSENANIAVQRLMGQIIAVFYRSMERTPTEADFGNLNAFVDLGSGRISVASEGGRVVTSRISADQLDQYLTPLHMIRRVEGHLSDGREWLLTLNMPGEYQIHRRPLVEAPPTAQRFLNLGAALAVEPERSDQWRQELLEIAESGTRKQVIHFAAGLIYAGAHSRVSWIATCLARPLIAGLCWVLRSDARTWGLLSTLLLWAGVETEGDTGLGAAILLVLCAFGALAWVVNFLRTRFNAHPPQNRESSE